jgi:acyl-CoA thioesterase FadM
MNDFVIPMEVQLSEVDSQGHLNSAVYEQYAEHARWRFLQSLGVDRERLLASGVGPVLLEQTIRYHRELRAGQTVLVSCAAFFDAAHDRRTFRVRQEFRMPEGDLVAELDIVCGLLDLTSRRLVADPRAHLPGLGDGSTPLMETNRIEGALDFDWLFDRHERSRWSPYRDVPPLSQIDRRKIDRDLVDGLAALARVEFSSVPAILDLVRIFADDPDVTAWLSIWFAEEVRHHLVLRRWTAAAGYDPSELIPPVTRPELGTPPPVATLAVNVIGEIRTTRLYAAMAEGCKEPVLATLLRRIAGDEGRHAQGFAHYARRWAERDPEQAIPLILRVGQLWCDPEYGHEHDNPAAQNYQSEADAGILTELHRRFVDREREISAICNLFSRICKLPLETPEDFITQLAIRKQKR